MHFGEDDDDRRNLWSARSSTTAASIDPRNRSFVDDDDPAGQRKGRRGHSTGGQRLLFSFCFSLGEVTEIRGPGDYAY